MLVSACDDGVVVKLGGGFTVYACVCYEVAEAGAPVPRGLHLGFIRIDGLEATGLIAYSAVASCRGRPDVVMLDSITIAGFNVVSPAGISALAGAPSLIVYNYRPSWERIHAAARKAPGPTRLRLKVLRLIRSIERVETAKGVLYVIRYGMRLRDAVGVIESVQVHSRIPEPLRAAHAVASEASKALRERGLLHASQV